MLSKRVNRLLLLLIIILIGMGLTAPLFLHAQGISKVRKEARILYNQCVRIANAVGDLVLFYLLSFHDIKYADLVRLVNSNWPVLRIRPRNVR